MIAGLTVAVLAALGGVLLGLLAGFVRWADGVLTYFARDAARLLRK